MVGTISETATDNTEFQLVTRVAPAVTFSRLDYVKVIVGYSPLDAPSIEEEQAELEEAENTEDTTPEGEGDDPTAEDGGEESSP